MSNQTANKQLGSTSAGLAEDDAQEGAGAAADTQLSVHQSFTDIQWCNGRALAAVQWHPARKGVMAVACVEPLNLTQRARRAGQPGPGHPAILLWNYRDPIYPEVERHTEALVGQWLTAGCAARL